MAVARGKVRSGASHCSADRADRLREHGVARREAPRPHELRGQLSRRRLRDILWCSRAPGGPYGAMGRGAARSGRAMGDTSPILGPRSGVSPVPQGARARARIRALCQARRSDDRCASHVSVSGAILRWLDPTGSATYPPQVQRAVDNAPRASVRPGAQNIRVEDKNRNTDSSRIRTTRNCSVPNGRRR